MEPNNSLLHLKAITKPALLTELTAIGKHYFEQQDCITAGHISKVIAIIMHDPTIVSPDTLKHIA